jgi:uncharacterized membrane protein YedE/YeeE
MNSFNPLPATLGVLLIGLASAVLWLGNGRIAGISGIFGHLLPPGRDWTWRVLFVLALVGGTALTALLVPGLGVGGPGGAPAVLVSAPQGSGVPGWLWISLAGLLTGVGTQLANGCTSGHGVCGIARLSMRSFVSVGIFFAVAILTVTLTGVVS